MDSSLQQARAIFYAMWRKRWLGLGAAWAVCLIGWLIVSLIPNSYQSEARLYVRYNALLNNVTQTADRGGALSEIDIIRQTLTSRPNLEKVLRRSDLDLTDVSEPELLSMIENLASNIAIAPQGSESLYALSYTARDASRSDTENAQFAQRVVQNLIDIFVEGNVTTNRDSLNQAIRFLDEQITQRAQQLEQAEARRAAFEQKYFDQIPGEGDVGSRLTQARTELGRVEQQLIEARSALGALQSQLSSTPELLRGSPFPTPGRSNTFGTGTVYDPTSARGRIEQLERVISDAISRGYTERHPDIVSARRQIERLRSEADKEPAAGAADPGTPGIQSNPAYVNLRSLVFQKQSEAAALAARQAQLSADVADLRSKQTQAPEIVAEQSKLNRDYSVLREGYNKLLESREQTRLRADIANQTNQVEFRIVDPPTLPAAAVAPNRPLLLTLALLAGLAAGLAAAFLASQLRPVYVSGDRLAAETGIPVLGTVSEVVRPEEKARSSRMRIAFAALGAVLVGLYGILVAAQFLGGGGAV